ncbi:MAG: peptidoglycan DD-metalloendopeptidase family protein [Bacteroidota bacterium]
MIIKPIDVLRHHKKGLVLMIVAGLIIVFRSIILFYTSVTLNNLEENSPPPPTMLYGIPVDSLYVETDRLKPGQTLSGLLLSRGISPQFVDSIIQQISTILPPGKLRAGQPFTFISTGDSLRKPLYFIYENSPISYTLVHLRGKPEARRVDKEIVIEKARMSTTIESSLWKALRGIEYGADLALALENVFGWNLDFFALQKGDEFTALYENQVCEGKSIGIGKILAARFVRKDQETWAFYFAPDSTGAFAGYYNEKGENMKRAFLKAPLKYARISSRFTGSRFHPVLRIYRPHHGVDYAAPVGTPVHSIGDGTVISAQYNGQAGKSVKIRHNSMYTSMYNHLSGYGPGIHPGARVKQGQVIGYVGSTGLSTGPHLDFRVYKNGSPVNPLTIESPPSEPLPEKYLDEYFKHVNSVKQELKFHRAAQENPFN